MSDEKPEITPGNGLGLAGAFEKVCHRMYIPMAIPTPAGNPLRPNEMKMSSMVANMFCVKEKCMLWNNDKTECWDVSAARGQAQAGDYAYAQTNDVSLEPRGN